MAQRNEWGPALADQLAAKRKPAPRRSGRRAGTSARGRLAAEARDTLALPGEADPRELREGVAGRRGDIAPVRSLRAKLRDGANLADPLGGELRSGDGRSLRGGLRLRGRRLRLRGRRLRSGEADLRAGLTLGGRRLPGADGARGSGRSRRSLTGGLRGGLRATGLRRGRDRTSLLPA